MNEQSGTPNTGQAGTTEPPRPTTGPRVSADQMRDVTRLRRSSTDRYIAGVAGGLGRHFDVDPTIVRVLLVVLTFFGGAGVLVYGAVWLFVPEDGHEQAPIDVNTDARRVVLIVAGAIALMIVFGTPFLGNSWGWAFPFPLLVIGLVAVAIYATRNQRGSGNAPPPPWGTAPTTPTASAPSAQEGSTMSFTDTRTDPNQPPPAWMPPPPPAYVPPPRPRRTGLVLFWPTLALIAIALGTLGIYDTSNEVTLSAYGALALGITGVMLLVGAFVARPGGLIALGFASSIALLVTSIVGATTTGNSFDTKDLRDAPTSAAAVDSGYHVPSGTISLDLREVRDLAALDGRTVDLGTNAGEIDVIVPSGVNVHVVADVRYAGQINVGDEMRDGLGQSLETTLTSSAAPGTPTLHLTIEVRFGQITVARN